MTSTLALDLRNDWKSFEVRWLTLLGTVLQAGSGAGGGGGSFGLKSELHVYKRSPDRSTFT